MDGGKGCCCIYIIGRVEMGFFATAQVRQPRVGAIKAFLPYNRGRDGVEVHVERRRSITVIPVTSSATHRVNNGTRRVDRVGVSKARRRRRR